MPSTPAKATVQQAPALYEPLAIALVGVAAGIALDRWAGWPAPLWWTAGAAAWFAWLALHRQGHERRASVVLVLLLAALGGAWHHVCWDLYAEDDLGRFARVSPQPAAIRAVALTGPRRLLAGPFDPLRAIPAADRSRLEVEATAIRDGDVWRPASGRLRLFVDGQLLGVHAGDQLQVFGQLAAPRPAANPGGFDGAEYARGDRQLSVMRTDFPDCVTVLERGQILAPRRVLQYLREGGDALLWRHLRHERSGLAAALLLGAREELDTEQTEAFFETGTVHVLAISGMHIAILAASLFYALRLGVLPRRVALVTVVLVTLAYTLLTDSEPSAVRAWVLVLLVCLAQVFGRRTSAVNCLALAALVVLLLNPVDLFRVGAQLSFLAVAVLIWCGDAWSRRPPPDALDRLIAATRPWPVRAAKACGLSVVRLTLAGLAVWLVELPLVMARFHLLSPSAVLLTTLSWIPVSLAMLFGFGVLALGWLVPPLGTACGWMCDVNLSLLDGMVTGTAPLPASHFWVPGPDAWWLAGFYGALFLAWALPHRRPPWRWQWALAAGWCAVGLAVPMARSLTRQGEETPLVATFLSVGHGCSVVLELPGGQTLLYDAGSLGSPRGASESAAGYLWSRGITHLDAVVVSHADVDHYNGLPELLKRFSVGVIYVSPVMFDEPSASLDKLRAAIEESGTPLRTIHGGQRLAVAEGCRIEVLHPPRRGVIGSDNANSLVLQIERQGRRILLTGDLESPGLEALLQEEPVDCDVLLAPHHGSHLSDPPGMSAWCNPEWVVISGGYGRDSDAVEGVYRVRGAEVLHTARDGAVAFTLGRGGVAVEAWIPSE